jgi:hypothetical protein
MRKICILFSLLATVGCANSDDKDAALSPYIDNDQDGFPETTDCNDKNPAIHPDASEMCDEIDNNCDGTIDEDGSFDAPLWYYDQDGDGFGWADTTAPGCEAPAGYVPLKTDCNDLDSASHPGATEMCDGVDNDCDDVIDEGSAYDALTWYRDRDGDGYGSYYENMKSCEHPEGFVCVADDDETTSPPPHDPCADRCDNDLDGLIDAEDPDCDDYDPTLPASDYREGEAKTWDMNGDSAADFDCVDTDPAKSPGLPEQCDDEDVDENCNMLVDDQDPNVEGTSRWFTDADNDSYGTRDSSLEACDQPSGMVDNKDDCDDAESLVNPSNAEVCGDDIDNDCDDLIDEEDAPTPLSWFADNDGDGYGDYDSPYSGGTSCAQPSGYVADGNDCNDTNADINPDAEEVWYDGTDDDCDGNLDDADEDGYVGEEAGGDDCADGDAFAHPDAPEVCGDGKDNDCDGDMDPCDMNAMIIGSNPGDRAGGAVAMGGDLNDDGIGDLVVGASRYNGTGLSLGAAFVFYGPVSDERMTEEADFILTGEADHDRAGCAVEIIGDTDNDGIAELLIGAYVEDGGGDGAGAAYLMSSPLGVGTSGTLFSLSDAAGLKLVGEVGGDQTGYSLSGAGDVNNDGFADIIIGGYKASPAGRSEAGMAHILFGPIEDDLDGADDGELDLSFANVRLYGADGGDQLAHSVSGAGDVDGDGFDDVIMGAPNATRGVTYTGVAFLTLGGVGMEGNLDLATDADGRFVGVNGADQAGYDVTGAGDVNGDGYGDFAVGAPGYDGGGSQSGAAYVVLGSMDIGCGVGSSCADTDLHATAAVLLGERNDDFAGVSLDGGADLNDDGVPDLVIGARLEDSTASDAGASYIMFGPFSPGTTDLSTSDGKFSGGDGNDWLGASVSSGMDVTGDGVDDMMLGAPNRDDSGDESGAAFLVGGGGW